MKKGLAYAAIGFLAYIIFAVVLLPADRVYGWIGQSLGAVKLYDVSGTIWSGAARGALIDGRPLRSVKWQIRPWSVFLGKVQIGWSFDNGDSWGKGVAALGMNKMLGLQDVQAQIPVSQLQPMLRLPVQLEGVLAVDVDDLDYDPATQLVTQATGIVTWNDAGVAKVTDASLGTFRLTVTSEDDKILGQLQDGGEGPLSANGNLVLTPDRKWSFQGEVALRDPQRRDVANVLNLLGRPNAEGKIPLQQTGTF